MPRNDAIQVSSLDAIHAGIRMGTGLKRTLEIYRELGGKIRDEDFATAWHTEARLFAEWSKSRRDAQG